MGFELNKSTGYFQNFGVDAMAFDDVYPEGHQAGVSLIMHGRRIATNGDLRFEPTPGQWQPVPKQLGREVNFDKNEITARLAFPDESKHKKGFNPLNYPDLAFEYSVTVRGEGEKIIVTVDLDTSIPPEFGVCFNLELFPGELMGKPWIMDDTSGIFPHQPNGPVLRRRSNYPSQAEYTPDIADDLIAEPYATGKSLTVRPGDQYFTHSNDPPLCFRIETRGEIKLFDGRLNHNNGWFVVSEEIPPGATTGAVEWVITPLVHQNWLHGPIVQISQVGYHPAQPKIAIIELDERFERTEERDAQDEPRPDAILYEIMPDGLLKKVFACVAKEWGSFLRYKHLTFDFSHIKKEGIYKIVSCCVGGIDGESREFSSESSVFRISRDIYERGVWQPVLEYFLPVQMCHMRVNEKYRVWHGLCHDDDARMAPINLNHFDGYVQGASTLTKFAPGEHVPGLNVGGWHDAGDFDIRIESQCNEIYSLALAFEEFGVHYDATTICQEKKVCEIHQPDGKNDVLQQIEHGVLSVVGGYFALGRFYRGIICPTLRQYVLLGDGAMETDGKISGDDRWVFTEENPARELSAAAHLAAASRALAGFNDELATKTQQVAREVYEAASAGKSAQAKGERAYSDAEIRHQRMSKIHCAVELFLTTREKKYAEFLHGEVAFIVQEIEELGWIIARLPEISDEFLAPGTCAESDAFPQGRTQGPMQQIKSAMSDLQKKIAAECAETPYGVPYRPQIWGAGWGIQRLGFQYYFLHKAFPEIFPPETVFSALNFVLGCHPGSNGASFASGVGAKSATVGYGANRADWSYIPGGTISGTGLIRPDFPELLEFPYLWQQTEYCIGTSSHYMFLVLAVREILLLQNKNLC
ncbi:MAG: glycoside hydrolase family 9 protein [Defluviitaleaceae bacterium]|nr:glycoside hydrolase family 9 protein [Defluviitaleaceae bacterium]